MECQIYEMSKTMKVQSMKCPIYKKSHPKKWPIYEISNL